MNEKVKQLVDMIEKSNKILVVSHTNPDQDAISSTIFTKNILREFFKKDAFGVLQGEIFGGIRDVKGVNENVTNKSFIEAMGEYTPDLVIIVDISNVRGLFKSAEEMQSVFKGISVAVIDHHTEVSDIIEADLLIRETTSSAAELLYDIFVNQLGFEISRDDANTVLLGIIADTGGFMFQGMINNPKKTFDIVAKLYEQGASTTFVLDILREVNENTVKILKEFFTNYVVKEDYVYSYISDEFADDPSFKKLSPVEYKALMNLAVNNYLDQFKGAKFGFLVRRDPFSEDKKKYNVSLRGKAELVDVAEIAEKMNGGGHKGASGGHVFANSIEEAISKVKEVIQSSL